MKHLGLLLCITFVLSMGVQANEKNEAQLITPTLWAASPDNFACNLTNISKRTRTVQVRIITNGTVLLDSGRITVEPMHTADHFVDGLENGGPIYCEFSVEGSKNWYRGSAKLFRDGANSSDFLVIVAY